MNIILFDPAEVQLPLSRNDPRARHLLQILHRQPGESFDAGLINGPRGRGTIEAITDHALALTFTWDIPPPPPPPIHLVIGLPRPQTSRDILREMATLGVASLHFVTSDKGEPSYARSSLWHSTQWRDCLIAGAAQAFCTRLPVVPPPGPLVAALAALPAHATRLALDNYEATAALPDVVSTGPEPVSLALGPERGWSERERQTLRLAGFTLAHLGSRVLRSETACIAAVVLVKAGRGWL